MSGKFNGFTNDDISHLKSKLSDTDKIKSVTGVRRMPDKKPPTQSVASARNHPPKNSKQNPLIKPEAMDSSLVNNNIQEALHFKPLPPIVQTAPEDESILPTMLSSAESSKDTSSILETPPFQGVSLKDFEAQRKVVEEQNRQKKDMLCKAIEQHSQRTAAEVKKLHDIKKDLTKLDSELASDVAILRKQIESASLHYMQTQKNYQNIESMFLKAKLDLHNASEKKELLTEHLCTIISHNENRKAAKLNELMEKVGLSSSGVAELPPDT